MPQGLEVITGTATAPGATLTALTMATGNTLTVRNYNQQTAQAYLLATWAFNNVAGVYRIRSPRLHDNVQGIRQRVDATDSRGILPRWGFQQMLYAQDTLIAELSGSAVAGQIETASMLIYYSDLPGISARFCTPAQLASWGVNWLGQEVVISTGVGGGYTGQVAVNANFDNFKANTDYALTGYRTDANAATVRIQGIDTGNLGIGGPAVALQPDVTAIWFEWLSGFYNVPLIPMFNSANKNAILVDVATNQAGGTVNVTLFFVELKPPALRT